MTLHISSRDAALTFSDLLRRVRENKDVFIIEEGGREICAITPIRLEKLSTFADLANVLRSLPPVDEEFLTTVEQYVRNSNQI